MKRSLIAASLLIGMAAVGCEKEESKPTPPSQTPPKPEVKDTVTGVSAAPAPAAAPAAAPTAAPAAQATADAAAAAAGTANAAAGEAEKKLSQVTQYINENKYDLAEKGLSELENNKASLPVSVADKLPGVRTALNTAKAAGAVKLPALPK